MPFARATGIGSTFDCADHSKSVCFFDSATISSPLIVFGAVSIVMSNLVLVHHENPKLYAFSHEKPEIRGELSCFRGCISRFRSFPLSASRRASP